MTQTFTKSEISLKNGKGGEPTWIIIKNSVYDVTGYMDKHPGGRDLLQEWAGKDATKAFNEMGHSGSAVSLLQGLKIGEVLNETINTPSPVISSYADEMRAQKLGKEKRKIKLFFCL